MMIAFSPEILVAVWKLKRDDMRRKPFLYGRTDKDTAHITNVVETATALWYATGEKQ